MKTESLKVSKVFSSGGDILYLLPHFQREYAWEKEQWKTLMNDILSVYEDFELENPPEHFMGSLVVINDGMRSGTTPAFRLVDGQQRLTTISLVLCALRDLLSPEIHGTILKRLEKLLLNVDEEGEYRYKLLPTNKYGDRIAYIALLDRASLPTTTSRIPEAYSFIKSQIDTWLQNGLVEAERLLIVIGTCLQVVYIELDQRDRAYEIFESLNAKGKELTQADLVRNYIAMRLPQGLQEQVFGSYWTKIEDMLPERRTIGRLPLGELTAFLRHYLSMRTGRLCNTEHVYARFRDRAQQPDLQSPADFAEEIKALFEFAGYYNKILRPDLEQDSDVRARLKVLQILEVSTASPFLLSLFGAFTAGHITKTDLLEALGVIENYLVRRWLAGEPTNFTNKMFPTLWRELDASLLGQTLRQSLLTRNYPSDTKIRSAVLAQEVYDNQTYTVKRLVFVLDSINRHLSKGSGAYTQLDGVATVEHIMPQNLSDEWKTALGENWKDVHEANLHRLGNLTLVTREWNSSLSNSSFSEKRKKLATNGLKLNSEWFGLGKTRWNEAAIKSRAEFLGEKILELWPALGVTPEPILRGSHPSLVRLLGETHPVKSWREVVQFTAERVSEVVDSFDQVVENGLSGYFRKEPFEKGNGRQLSNGYWIYIALSGESAQRLCRRLLESAGIGQEELEIFME